MISMDDRISEVLARDERLIDVLTAFSPHFSKLRDPRLRRMMGRLVTVRQAAGIAGVEPDSLLEALNRQFTNGAVDPPFAAAEASEPGATTEPAIAPRGGGPDFIARLSSDQVIDLDVRDDLRAGREPFSRIMAAVAALGDDEVLRLRAIFEPVPLYAVLEKRGLSYWTERLAEDDWRVWFFGPSVNVSAQEGAERHDSRSESGRTTAGIPPDPKGEAFTGIHPGHTDIEPLHLDVRGLEPPEPMVRTLAALESLPPGGVLVQTNVRVPRFLIEELDRRGFPHEVRVLSADEVEVTIRRSL